MTRRTVVALQRRWLTSVSSGFSSDHGIPFDRDYKNAPWKYFAITSHCRPDKRPHLTCYVFPFIHRPEGSQSSVRTTMAARAARKSAFDTEKARQYLSRKIVFHMI